MKKKIGFFIALMAIFIYPGCSSYNVKELVTNDNLKLAPMKANIGYDYCFFRVDVVRQFTASTQTVWVTTYDSKGRPNGSRMETRTVYTPVPYHYLGTDLGNGFFVDLNSNLSIDLLKLLNIPENKNFRIVNKGKGLLGSDVTIERKDNKMTLEISGLFGSKSEIALSKNKATVKGGFISGDQDLLIDKSRITMAKNEIEQTATGTKSAYANYAINLFAKENFVKLTKAMTIVKDGETLRVINNDRPVYTFAHNKNGYLFYDNNFNGIRIEISPAELKITNAAGVSVYTITYL